MNRLIVALCAILMITAVVTTGCSLKPAKPAADTTSTDTTEVEVEVFVKLDKDQYEPDEIITVKYSALEEYDDNAWIGLIPSEVPHGDEEENDEYDLQYHLIGSDLTGEVTFVAPTEPGLYDIRMFTSDFEGVEATYVSFEVFDEDAGEPVIAVLDLDEYEFGPGDEIELDFSVSRELDPSAWIGIIPSEVAHGDEDECDKYDVDYEYLPGKLEGTLIFNAPDEPGSYDFRLFDGDDYGKELTSVTFTVK